MRLTRATAVNVGVCVGKFPLFGEPQAAKVGLNHHRTGNSRCSRKERIRYCGSLGEVAWGSCSILVVKTTRNMHTALFSK